MELGRTEIERRGFDRAQSLLKEALDVRRERFGAGSWKCAEAQLHLAEAVAAAGKPVEARLLLESSARILRDQRGPANRLTRAAEDELRRLGPS